MCRINYTYTLTVNNVNGVTITGTNSADVKSSYAVAVTIMTPTVGGTPDATSTSPESRSFGDYRTGRTADARRRSADHAGTNFNAANARCLSRPLVGLFIGGSSRSERWLGDLNRHLPRWGSHLGPKKPKDWRKTARQKLSASLALVKLLISPAGCVPAGLGRLQTCISWELWRLAPRWRGVPRRHRKSRRPMCRR